MKRQYQPSKIRRKRQHGFLNRNSSKSGKATLAQPPPRGPQTPDAGLIRRSCPPVPRRHAEPDRRPPATAPARPAHRAKPRFRARAAAGPAAGARLSHRQLAAACRTARRRRLGVVTSKKIGSAVARSRARRLLRESFRQHQHEFCATGGTGAGRAQFDRRARFCRGRKGFSDDPAAGGLVETDRESSPTHFDSCHPRVSLDGFARADYSCSARPAAAVSRRRARNTRWTPIAAGRAGGRLAGGRNGFAAAIRGAAAGMIRRRRQNSEASKFEGGIISELTH